MQVNGCMRVSVCTCACARARKLVHARSRRDETRLSAALSDCTHEKSQNNNKDPSVGRMKALSPTISAQFPPLLYLWVTPHTSHGDRKETQTLVWPQQFVFCMLMRLLFAFFVGGGPYWVLIVNIWWELELRVNVQPDNKHLFDWTSSTFGADTTFGVACLFRRPSRSLF